MHATILVRTVVLTLLTHLLPFVTPRSATAQIALPSKRPVAYDGDVWAHSAGSLSVNNGTHTDADSYQTHGYDTTSAGLDFDYSDATGAASVYSATYAALAPTGTNTGNTVHAYASATAFHTATYISAPAEASGLGFGYAGANFQVRPNPTYPTAGADANSATLSCSLYLSLVAYPVNRTLVFSPYPTTTVSASSGDSYIMASPLDHDGEYWYIEGILQTSSSGNPSASPTSVGDTVLGNDQYFYYGTQATQVYASHISIAGAQYDSTVNADSGSDGEDHTLYVGEAVHVVNVP